MENIQHLLRASQQSEPVKNLINALAAGQNYAVRLQLDGLKGSQKAFVIASAVQKLPADWHHLVIATDKESAAYLQNDLAGVLSEEQVFFFPDSFKRPGFFDDLNPTQILQRSETVNKITATAPPGSRPAANVAVTYPEALFEKVVSPKVLAEHRIEIAKGHKLDVDFVISVLVEFGFHRTDFVYEPGQFSVRGGIVDLFSYGNDLPYRVELFDDEVESIRIFDPLTQLSQRNVAQVNIVPNLNTRFRQEQKVSLLSVLDSHSVLWVEDFQMLLDRLQWCFEKAEQFATKLTALDSTELREIFRDRAFLFPADVVKEAAGKSLVFLEKQSPSVWQLIGNQALN